MSCDVIRNETRTNETGPRSVTVSERSKVAPIRTFDVAGRVRLRSRPARRPAHQRGAPPGRGARLSSGPAYARRCSSGSVIASIACCAASRIDSGDEHLLRGVLGRARVVLDGRLELRVDPGRLEDRLDLLGLGHVLGERDLHHLVIGRSPRHRRLGSRCLGRSASQRATLDSCGPPRSWNGSSMISKSLGTTVSGKTARASRAASGPK